MHNIANYVAMTISANALLALGASPSMVHAAEEAEDFTAISDAVVVNIGTLSPSCVSAVQAAVDKELGKPWVLDPGGAVACGHRRQCQRDHGSRR